MTEKRLFRIHLLFSVLQGFFSGGFALNEFILLKNLSASNFTLSILLQLSVVVLSFTLFVDKLVNSFTNKRLFLILFSVLNYIPLVGFAFFPLNVTNNIILVNLFLVIFGLFFLSQIIILPYINNILKHYYSNDNFGKYYGYSSTVNKIAIMVSTFIFGLLMDRFAFSYVLVFPVLSVIGFASTILLFNRKIFNTDFEEKVYKTRNIQRSVFNSVVSVFKGNKPFLHFEIGFMFYGISWMIITELAIIYFNDILKMNYSSLGFYKNGYNLIAILLLPLFSKLIGKIDPRLFTVFNFLTLVLFAISLAITPFFISGFELFGIMIYPTLLVAYSFYGVFAATMALLWFIGSSYFAKKEDAGFYQSIHLILTGFRGIFSYFVGIKLLENIGYTWSFLFSITLLLVAIFVLLWSYRKDKLIVA